MVEQDRFTRGFYAGLIAGVLQNILSFLSYALGLTTLRMADWSAVIIFGKSGPFSTGEIMLGLASHILWCGTLGIIFVYLILYVKHQHFTLKGLIFGWSVWFLIYGVTLLYKVEPTLGLPIKTPLSDLIGASVYGLVLVWSLTKLKENVSNETKSRP